MKKRIKKVNNKRLPRDLKYERAKLMFQYRKEGKTLAEIGKIFRYGRPLSREGVRQIIDDYQRKLDKINNGSIMSKGIKRG